MPGKWLTLDEKVARMTERKRRREQRMEVRKALAEARFARRVAKHRLAQSREEERLKMQIQLLRDELGKPDWTYAYPSDPEREFVKEYRSERDWSIRKMVRHCGCEFRHIKAIESKDTSVYMLKKTWEKIVQATGCPTGRTESSTVALDPERWTNRLSPVEIETVRKIVACQAEGLSVEQVRERLGMTARWAFDLIAEHRIVVPKAPAVEPAPVAPVPVEREVPPPAPVPVPESEWEEF